jgi:predicted RNA-binding Zn ribbon-like protein
MEPLWADLINSDWRDYRGTGKREDRLENDGWLGPFVARAGWRDERLPSADERQALRRLRALLRRIVDAVRTAGAVPEGDLRALNRVLAGSPVVRRLDQAGENRAVVLVAAGRGVGRVMGEVAASFAAMLAEGEAERLKICANPDCGWVIYDESRNRSRRWCDVKECGNLIKVRRHRRRKRVTRGS